MLFFKRRKTADKRRQYRVEATETPDLTLSLLEPDGQLMPMAIVDVSAGGLAIQVVEKASDRLKQGATVELVFSLRGEPAPVEAKARVMSLKERPGLGLVAGMEFLDLEEFFGKIRRGMWKIFNRRKSFRVRPLLDESPGCTTTKKGQPYALNLHDVSLGGLCLRSSPEEAEWLHSLESISFQLLMPGEVSPIKVSGIRRHSWQRDDVVFSGYQFESDDEDLLEPIMDYVMKRQRDTASRT